MIRRIIIFLASFILIAFSLCGKESEIDSLIQLLGSNTDSFRQIDILNEIADELYDTDFEKSVYYAKKAQIEATNQKYELGIAKSQLILAKNYIERSLYTLAIENLLDAEVKFKNLGDIKHEGIVLRFLGNISWYMNEWQNAIKYYTDFLSIAKSLNDSSSIIAGYMNLGISYNQLNQFDTAVAYLNIAYDLAEEAKFIESQANILLNLSGIYFNKGDYLKAYDNCLNIEQEYLDFLSVYTKGVLYYSLAELSLIQSDFSSVNHYLNLTKEIYLETKSLRIQKEYYRLKYKLDSTKGNFKQALYSFYNFKRFNDSIYTSELKAELSNSQAKYEYEKKENEIRELEHEKQIYTLRNQKQRLFLFIFIGLFVLLFLVIVLILILYRIKNRTNILLERKNYLLKEQNEEIEQQRDFAKKQHEFIKEKNEEIESNITYAKRIQLALMPQEELFYDIFPESFIFNLPRDIVSGDFYWVSKVKEKRIIAVADCTGHGVSGAFMSILGINFLNEIITKNEITDPASILNKLRSDIIHSLHQKNYKIQTNDGMDISLCVINDEKKTIEFAGANNPVFIVENLKGKKELIELQPDKMPISHYYDINDSFRKEIYKFKKDSIIYLFSDGYADQFGGLYNKKLNKSRFKNILLQNADKKLLQQKDILEKEFYKWKGDSFQVDDVLVVGLRL